jgi:hypothetical protein
LAGGDCGNPVLLPILLLDCFSANDYPSGFFDIPLLAAGSVDKPNCCEATKMLQAARTLHKGRRLVSKKPCFASKSENSKIFIIAQRSKTQFRSEFMQHEAGMCERASCNNVFFWFFFGHAKKNKYVKLVFYLTYFVVKESLKIPPL